MSVHALKPVALSGLPAKADPSTMGKPPRLEWLAIADLVINDDYQREISAKGLAHIQAIARHFSWSKFSPVIVAKRGKVYEIVDGQHSTIAALSVGHKRVPACIVDCSAEDAAAIFAAVNGDVTPISVLQLFKAARVSKEPWALAVDRVCRKAGIEPMVYPIPKNKQRPMMTMAIGTLRNRMGRYGEAVMAATLCCLAASPSAMEPGFFTSSIISSWAFVFSANPAWMARPQLVAEAFAKHYSAFAGQDAVVAAINRALDAAPTADECLTIENFRGRGFSDNQIAAKLRIPYAKVRAAAGKTNEAER